MLVVLFSTMLSIPLFISALTSKLVFGTIHNTRGARGSVVVKALRY